MSLHKLIISGNKIHKKTSSD